MEIGGKTLDAFQERIMAEVGRAIAERRSGVVMGPVGSGKSLVATHAVLEGLALGIPVLLVQPTIELLHQNLQELRGCAGLSGEEFGLLVARNERFPADLATRRNRFGGRVTLASCASLTNKAADAAVLADIADFGARGGLVVVDEGHGAAADGIGAMLAALHAAGSSGILLSATPFRTDGRDPMAPFGTTTAESILAVASHDEVVASGRTVPTLFTCADAEYAALVGAAAFDKVEELYERMLESGDSIDEASSKAMSRFFRTDDPARQAIGTLLLEGIVGIYLRHCAGRRLTMVHCDSVELAAALSTRLAEVAMPEGTPRAGMPCRVAHATGSGADVANADELEGSGRSRRSSLIERAREGAFDVIVNVRALSTGTNIPEIDTTLFACLRRSPLLARQSSGRAERKAPGKAHHLLVDIGSSTVELYTQLVAAREGREEAVGSAVRVIPDFVRAEFLQWLEGDPGIAAKIHESALEKTRRAGGRRAAIERTKAKPTAHPLAPGLTCCSSRRRVDGGLDATVALIADIDAIGVDLRAKVGAAAPMAAGAAKQDAIAKQDAFPGKDAFHGIPTRTGAGAAVALAEPEATTAPDPGTGVGADAEAAPELDAFSGPRYAVAVYDETTRAVRQRLTQTLDQALAFAAFWGVKTDPDKGMGPSDKAKSEWAWRSAGLPQAPALMQRAQPGESSQALLSANAALLHAETLTRGLAAAFADVLAPRPWPGVHPWAVVIHGFEALDDATVADLRRYVAVRRMIAPGRKRAHGVRFAALSASGGRIAPEAVAQRLGVARNAVVDVRRLLAAPAPKPREPMGEAHWRALHLDPGVVEIAPADDRGAPRALAGLEPMGEDGDDDMAAIHRLVVQLEQRVVERPAEPVPDMELSMAALLRRYDPGNAPGPRRRLSPLEGTYRILGVAASEFTMRWNAIAALEDGTTLDDADYALSVIDFCGKDAVAVFGTQAAERRDDPGNPYGTPGRTYSAQRLLDASFHCSRVVFAMIEETALRTAVASMPAEDRKAFRRGLAGLLPDHLARRDRRHEIDAVVDRRHRAMLESYAAY